MNIRAALEREHSKKQTTAVVDWVGNDQSRFNQLLHLFLTGEYRIVQRAAWPMSYCVIRHPQLIEKHYKEILSKLYSTNQPVAVKRNILRILDQIPEIPKSHHGQIMDACFKFVEDPNESIAPQAFSLGILIKLSRIYSEIKPELKILIEARLPHVTAAFKSRAQKFLKEVGQ